MKIEKIIPVRPGEAIVVLDSGAEQLVKLELSKDTHFHNNGVFKKYSDRELIEFLSNADDEIDEVSALVEAIDSFLTDKFLNVYLENDEYAKDDLRKVFRLLDMTNSKLDTIKRYTATTTNSLIKND
jgi:hypothetical protein